MVNVLSNKYTDQINHNIPQNYKVKGIILIIFLQSNLFNRVG